MTVKEKLRQVHKLDLQIEHLKGELEALETKMEGNGAISYNDEAKGTGKAVAPQERFYSLYQKTVDELNEALVTYIDTRGELHKLISQLDSTLYEVLYRRYFKYEKWEQIAVGMNYAYRTVTKLHGKALQELNKIIQECPQCPI